jgi:hypothetical protein
MTTNNIKDLCNELDQYLDNNNLSIVENYRESARKFHNIIKNMLEYIILELGSELDMSINNVKILASGSVLKGSTAMGFIVEEIITRILKDSNLSNNFIFPLETIDSAYDLKYNHSKIDLLCNLKVEKHGELEKGEHNNKVSSNNGIVAGKILQKEYAKNIDIPKLYLISKVPYIIDLDNSKLLLLKERVTNHYLESFICSGIKSDNRNWSQEFNPLSGRLQMPTKTKLHNYSINTIPEYKEIRNLISHLESSL